MRYCNCLIILKLNYISSNNLMLCNAYNLVFYYSYYIQTLLCFYTTIVLYWILLHFIVYHFHFEIVCYKIIFLFLEHNYLYFRYLVFINLINYYLVLVHVQCLQYIDLHCGNNTLIKMVWHLRITDLLYYTLYCVITHMCLFIYHTQILVCIR